MNIRIQALRLPAVCILLLFCLLSAVFAAGNSKKGVTYETLAWIDLLPAQEIQQPFEISVDHEQLTDNQLGMDLLPLQEDEQSFEISIDNEPLSDDQLSIDLENAIADTNSDVAQVTPALGSSAVLEEMDGKAVKIPGFIVPLEFNEKQQVTQFFLVPYFGACIHVPPPPPNQIVYVESKEGVEVSSIYDAVWISGVMKTTLTQNETATSAYSIELSEIEKYKG